MPRRRGPGTGARPGAAHHKAKLNDDLVREIRRRYDGGELLESISESLLLRDPPVDIKSCYGTLYPVVKRRSWRHVE